MNSNNEYTALAVLVALAHECRDAVAAHPIGVEEVDHADITWNVDPARPRPTSLVCFTLRRRTLHPTVQLFISEVRNTLKEVGACSGRKT